MTTINYLITIYFIPLQFAIEYGKKRFPHTVAIENGEVIPFQLSKIKKLVSKNNNCLYIYIMPLLISIIIYIVTHGIGYIRFYKLVDKNPYCMTNLLYRKITYKLICPCHEMCKLPTFINVDQKIKLIKMF